MKSHAAQTTAPEFDAVTFGVEEALKAMVEYQVESLRFVGRRTDCKLEYLRSLCHYIEWQDMAEVQRSWFKEWLADSGKEMVRLAATGFALASDFLPLPCSCTARHAARGAITPMPAFRIARAGKDAWDLWPGDVLGQSFSTGRTGLP